jgi:hypothetical protein
LRFNVQGKLPLQNYTLARWLLPFFHILKAFPAQITHRRDFFYPAACKAASLAYLCGALNALLTIKGLLVWNQSK